MTQDPTIQSLIPLQEAADLSDLSAGHVRLLVRTGKLWGAKIGRNWVTTREALTAYLETERKPGPKK